MDSNEKNKQTFKSEIVQEIPNSNTEFCLRVPVPEACAVVRSRQFTNCVLKGDRTFKNQAGPGYACFYSQNVGG